VKGSIGRLSRRWDRIRVMSEKPGKGRMPLEFWLCRGLAEPYLKGDLFFFIRQQLKPKERKVIPSDLLVDGEFEILERTMLRPWMAQWLKVVKWC